MIHPHFVLLADSIGIVGVILILLTYVLLQTNRLSATALFYSVLNFIGAGMIMYSLFYDWNTPAVVMEAAWMLVSFYGIIQAWRQKLLHR